MTLKSQQLAAILKAGLAMVNADGKVEQNELVVLTHELIKFNVPKKDIPMLLALSDSMDASEMFLHLKSLSVEAQKYVAGYLATIMISDGDINEQEVNVWQLTCTLAGFPSMSLHEAVQFWTNH